jgi:hypothetical protein
MNDRLPEIYWYFFWTALVVGLFAFGIFQAMLAHRRNLRALEVLRIYAEKGIEPPAAIAGQLAGQILDPDRAAGSNSTAQDRSALLLKRFLGFLFAACVSWALLLWLVDTGAAKWAIFASMAARAFFGMGAFGLLLSAVIARRS